MPQRNGDLVFLCFSLSESCKSCHPFFLTFSTDRPAKSACAAAAVRLYYLMVFLNTTDQMFTVSRVGLWSIGEMTAGFLIIGIPSIPKFIKTIPVSESLVSLIRTLTRTQPSGLSSKTPRQYTPPEPSGRRNSPPGLSVDEYDMDTIKDTSYSLHHKQSGILRETQVDVTRERAGPGNY